MTTHNWFTRCRPRLISGIVISAVGVAAMGIAGGSAPPAPDTGHATTTIALPHLTITGADGTSYDVDLGDLAAQALTDTDSGASLGLDSPTVLGTSLPGWQVDTSGGAQSGDHPLPIAVGPVNGLSATGGLDLFGYDVHTAVQSAYSSLGSLAGSATVAPLDLHADLGQHGLAATVEPATSSGSVELTVSGLSFGLGDLLSTTTLDNLPLDGLVQIITSLDQQFPGLNLTLPAGAAAVTTQLDALSTELTDIGTGASQLAAAQQALADLIAGVPSIAAAQQQLADTQAQLTTDLDALQTAQQQLGTDTATQLAQNAQVTTLQDAVDQEQAQLDTDTTSVTTLTALVNSLTQQLTDLLADPLQAVLAAQVAAQLQDAQDQLAAAQAAVAADQTARAAAQAALDTGQQALDQANASVAADQALIATLQQQVVADQAAVTSAQQALDDLVTQVANLNQPIADAQALVDQGTTSLTDLLTTLGGDVGALPDLDALRTQLVSLLTSTPLVDVGTLGATLTSTASDAAGSGTVTCTVTGASVLGQAIPVGPCSTLVDKFADIATAIAGALAHLPLTQPVVPVLEGLAESTTLTTPAPVDTETTGGASLTPLHLALPTATLGALTDATVTSLAAALGSAQQSLGALGLPAASAALAGPIGVLGTAVAGLPSGAGLAGLHTAGFDVSLVGLSTAAVHHRSLGVVPAGAGPASGPAGSGGGAAGGGTVANPADPADPSQPRAPADPPAPRSQPPADPPTQVTERAPAPALPFTGDNAAGELAAALVLVLVGSHLLVHGRRRPN